MSVTTKPIDMSALKGGTSQAPAAAAAQPAGGTAMAQAMTDAQSKAGTPESKSTTTSAPKAKAKAPAKKAAAKKPAAKAKAPAKKQVVTDLGEQGVPPAKAAAKPTTVAPGAEGNSQTQKKADEAKAAGLGDNSHVTLKEMESAATKAGEALAGVMDADKKIERSKEKSDTLRKQAAEQVFPIMERLGLDPNWGSDFAKKAKEFPEYEKLRELVCEALSIKVRDKIERKQDKNGYDKAPIFTGRVKKAWSRLATSYKEGGDGGSTNADNKGREAAKARNKTNIAKADTLDHLIKAYQDGDTDTVEGQLKSAAARWPNSDS